jgi:hypothetical protein
MAEMTVDAEYHTRPGNTPETVCLALSQVPS